ncbi:hypothetical protein EG328_009006 [Venturia inaequalis]|uniref:Uncharacterized protein n=1 Tax=Venturia inaequalis TaxID=5025 RepID=A0A8H3UBL6_VENIN|nr:hypothetical protein EG328_009006 [Venturia inaequalis]
MSLQLPTPIPAHISVLSHKTKSVHFGKQNPLIHRSKPTHSYQINTPNLTKCNHQQPPPSPPSSSQRHHITARNRVHAAASKNLAAA